MECPMCQELYDEKKLIPRNLPCGHTFCEFCLGQIILVKGFIECPNCRKKLNIDIHPESLSKNFIALDLALKQRQLQTKLQLCQQHSEFQLFFCEDCQEHLCTQCIVKAFRPQICKARAFCFASQRKIAKSKKLIK